MSCQLMINWNVGTLGMHWFLLKTLSPLTVCVLEKFCYMTLFPESTVFSMVSTEIQSMKKQYNYILYELCMLLNALFLFTSHTILFTDGLHGSILCTCSGVALCQSEMLWKSSLLQNSQISWKMVYCCEHWAYFFIVAIACMDTNYQGLIDQLSSPSTLLFISLVLDSWQGISSLSPSHSLSSLPLSSPLSSEPLQ